jgi:hypothetical protein
MPKLTQLAHIKGVFKYVCLIKKSDLLRLKYLKVENHNALYDHYQCTRLRLKCFSCGPKMTNSESVGPKRMH